MNIKKKFQSIDQSQLSESQKEILGKIKTATKDFTITDEKALQKVDGALDNIIEKLKKTNPQAIKGEEKKEEAKPKKEVVKKEPKTETKTPKEPKKEVGGKRTIFSIAKEIRKADESWEEAKKRAKKVMEGEREETTKKMKTETDKLLAFIKRRKELEGLSGTSIKKDSKVEAMPKGRRISKKGWKNQYGESEGGKVYYENRDNRTDRLAPKFEDKIYLEGGGYAGGGYVVIAKSEKGGGFIMSKPSTKAKAEKLKSLLTKIDGETNEVMTVAKASKLSGLAGKEYLKYADGGAIIGTPETPLARGLDMDYTTLVGETGAMSSGELFANGGYADKGVYVETLDEEIDLSEDGRVKAIKTQQGGNKSFGELREMHGASPEALAFAEGGSLGNHGLKQGDQIIKTMSGGVQKVKTKSGDIVYVNLANGYRGATPPLPFDGGGAVKKNLSRDRKFLNYRQNYEVRYSKDKPNRRGYGYEEGGFMADVYNDGGEIRKMQLGEPVIYKGETWEVAQKDGVVGLASMRQGSWGRDFPFVPISRIDARREVKDFYGNDVIIPYLVEDFAEGGTIDAFQMRLVRGVDSKPSEVLTTEQEVKFAKGGAIKNEDIKVGEEFWLSNGDVIEIVRLFTENIDEDWVEYKRNGEKKENSVKELRLFINRLSGKKQKSFRERRNEYLEKLGSKEADVWDKIGAESGSEIRNNEEMLRAYAEGVEEMLQKEGVGKGSFDQEDYDFYTDENWHLFNEFLVWNGYYEPEMTKTEKAWREDRFKDPKYKNYVSNPKVISLSGGSKPKSSKYIVKADIKEVKVKTDAGYEYTFKGTDVLNGVNILEKGSLLKNNATYVAKRNIIHVELKNGEKVKPANGYWIKKDAKGELFKPESKEEKMTYEEFLKKRPKSVTGQVYSTNFGGGEGKVVKRTFYYGRSKYIDRVGWFNRDKGKSITDEVAYKLYLEEPLSTNDKKSFSGGGSTTKRGGAMVLAKQIRKDGESWQSALKRANQQLKK